MSAKGTGGAGPGQEGPPGEANGWRPCQVETYSGHRLHERPRRFSFHGEWLEVCQIRSRWRAPENFGFAVTAHDSRHFLLQYEPLRDAWEVLLCQASGPAPP